MKKTDREDFLSAATRKDLGASARAAEVLFAADQFLRERLGDSFFYHPRVYKNGSLRVAVESPAAAHKVYAQSEELLIFLRERFPAYRFRDLRTEIADSPV